MGVWSLGTGELIALEKLHGRVARLVVEGAKVAATTDAGDSIEIDLSVLEQPYCDLLADVWRAAPYVWESGGATPREYPRTHPCRPGAGGP